MSTIRSHGWQEVIIVAIKNIPGMTVVSMKKGHIPFLWKFIENTDCFSDEMKINTLDEFEYYMRYNAIDPLVALKDNIPVMCVYLEAIHDNFGRVSMFSGRRLLKPKETIDVIKANRNYYIDKYKLNMLYVVIRKYNKASQKMIIESGFKKQMLIEHAMTVKGQPCDGFLFTLLKEGILICPVAAAAAVTSTQG